MAKNDWLEGGLFFIAGGALALYSVFGLSSSAGSGNWALSPALFPALLALALMGLGVFLLLKKALGGQTTKSTQSTPSTRAGQASHAAYNAQAMQTAYSGLSTQAAQGMQSVQTAQNADPQQISRTDKVTATRFLPLTGRWLPTGLCLLTLLYVALLPHWHFRVATPLYLAAFLLLAGERRIWMLALLPISVTAAFYYLFEAVFEIMLP